MHLARLMVIVVVMALPACQRLDNWAGEGGNSEIKWPPPQSRQAALAAELRKLAYLTVISLELAPDSVKPGYAFSVKLRIRNDGETSSRPFEAEAQASTITASAVKSYPVGGKEVPTIGPHEIAELTLTRKEGLSQPGSYRITVSLHHTSLEIPAATDRFNPETPEKILVVQNF